MTIETGGPAFPRQYSFDDQSQSKEHAQEGMTLRDYFAAKAMTAIYPDVQGLGWQKECAKCAYELADAMLEARAAVTKVEV